MEIKRAVIYIRVSDPSQIENNSLETQLKACKQYAENNGYEIVKVFREEGVSAKHTHTRQAMREMLEYSTLKSNKISAVIIYKMDRWSRNVEEGLLAESLLAKYGIPILPVTEITEQSPIGKAVRTILMTMGQLDNELKGERVKDNMKTMFKSGLWCWKPRIGYKRPHKTREENKGKAVVPDGRLAEILQALFIKATEVPTSKKFLADYINNLGFETIYGSKADGRFVSRILKDTFYYGYMYAPKWKEYAWGKHKPLIDQNIWERANINVFGRKRKYKSQDSTIFVLKGLLNCQNCNHPLTSSNPKGTSKHYLYYECHNSSCRKHGRMGVDVAHEEFLKTLSFIKPSKRVLKMFVEMVFNEWDETINDAKREASILDEQIKNLEDRLTAIAESTSKKILTEEEAHVSADKVRKELIPLRVSRADIRIEQYNTEAVKHFTENFLTHLDKLWEQLELPHKQALQNDIFPNGVTGEKKKIRINSLSSSFELIQQMEHENVDLVSAETFELSRSSRLFYHHLIHSTRSSLWSTIRSWVTTLWSR